MTLYYDKEEKQEKYLIKPLLKSGLYSFAEVFTVIV